MPFGIGDVRVAARGEWLLDRIVATGSLVVRKLGGGRAGEVAVHRFLSSPYASVGAIVETLAARTAEQCAGRRIVAIQDTTEVNFAGRSARRRGLGPGGNGRDAGFFLHPVLAVDVDSEAVIGLAGARIWTRAAAPAGGRDGRAFAEKKSARWQTGCATAAETLSGAAALTMIADRESDIYELFAGRPPRLDLIVRAAQNRRLADDGHLFGALAAAPELARRLVRVPPRRPGDKGPCGRAGRQGRRAAHQAPEEPPPPRPGCRRNHPHPGRGGGGRSAQSKRGSRLAPPHHACCRQCRAAPPAVIDLYRLRWRIEQVFRALKNDGMQLLETASSSTPRPCSSSPPWGLAPPCAPSSSSMPEAAARGRHRCRRSPSRRAARRRLASLEGKTERQKNPHPPDSLGLARLDRRPARRLELLLQAPRTQNHARRMDPPGRHAARLRPRHQRTTSVNPVAPQGGREGAQTTAFGVTGAVPITDPGAAIGYAPRPAWHRRLFAGSVGPVLVVCLAILALWYVGAMLLNAPFAREKLARADPLYSTGRPHRRHAQRGAARAALAASGGAGDLQDHRRWSPRAPSAASSITAGSRSPPRSSASSWGRCSASGSPSPSCIRARSTAA